MGYYESVLKSKPWGVNKLNAGETAYVDLTGRGNNIVGTLNLTAPLVAGSTKGLYLVNDVTFQSYTPVWRRGREFEPFTIEAWVQPLTFNGTLSFMGRTALYDGLISDGDYLKFLIKAHSDVYYGPKWPIPDLSEAYYMVGTYSAEKMELWINAELVDSIDTPADILTSGFKATAFDDIVYGDSPVTTQKGVIDAPATYGRVLSPDEIREHFREGRDVVPMRQTVQGIQSATLNIGGWYWDGTMRDIHFHKIWDDDWTTNAVLVDTVQATDGLRPLTAYGTGLSIAGTWRSSIQLAATEDTSIGGVRFEWDGDGAFTVQTSIDNGSNWITQTNGRIHSSTFGYNTQPDKVMDVKITFTGGVASDPAVVRKLTATVFADAIVKGENIARPITLTANVSTAITTNEPIERNLNAGFDFYDGTATFAADASGNIRDINAWEFWIRPRRFASGGTAGTVISNSNGSVTIPSATNAWTFTSGPLYVNGISATSGSVPVKYNEWTHLLWVVAAANNVSTVGGNLLDAQIAMIGAYPSAPSSAAALTLYQSYGKYPVLRIDDTSVIQIVEHATPLLAYGYNWNAV